MSKTRRQKRINLQKKREKRRLRKKTKPERRVVRIRIGNPPVWNPDLGTFIKGDIKRE